MGEKAPVRLRAVAGASAAIAFIVLGLFTLASVATNLLGLPASFDPPLALRLTGAVMLVTGVAFASWLLRYRSPLTMITSTYYTFSKMFARAPMSKLEGRTEPLVVEGPQKYVRNPLYFAATTLFFGWALVWGGTALLVGAAFVLVWFALVQIPFEEKELRAIFGEEFVRYAAEVPMLIPFTKRKQNRRA
jgi:protein-S-isoprenylcysteine O-methyltransferase Ste14